MTTRKQVMHVSEYTANINGEVLDTMRQEIKDD